MSGYEFIEGANCKFCGGPIMRETWDAPDIGVDEMGNFIKLSDKKTPTDYCSCHFCGFRYTIKEAEELVRSRGGGKDDQATMD